MRIGLCNFFVFCSKLPSCILHSYCVGLHCTNHIKDIRSIETYLHLNGCLGGLLGDGLLGCEGMSRGYRLALEWLEATSWETCKKCKSELVDPK